MSQRDVEITAVLISYNGERFLEACLRTLVENLERITHEIIIIDNGSTDGSVDLIASVCPQAQLIRNEKNLGFAKAINIGLEAARGEYLYLLNQDLRFRKGATQAMLDRLKSDSAIGLIGPKFVGFDGLLQSSVRAFPSYRHVIFHALFLDRLFPQNKKLAEWRMSFFDHESECFVDQPMGAVMMIPRSVVDKVGLMDEKFWLLFNDVDYCRRLKEAGFKRLYFPSAVVEHYVGGSTARIPYRLKAISHRALFRYLKKYAHPAEYPLLFLCGLILLLGLPFLIVVAWLRRISGLKPSS